MLYIFIQIIYKLRSSLVILIICFLIKLLLNSVLIHYFAGVGSILATGLAVGVASSLNLWRIQKVLAFSYVQTAKRTLFVIIFSGIMFGVIMLTKYLLGFVLPFDTNRGAAIIMLAVGIIVGGAVYLFIAYKSTLLDHVLGDTNILDRFRRKKHASR